MMNTTQLLHDMGQSLWLDNITRDMLNDGTLEHYRDHLSVSGLTSNPTSFERAIGRSVTYDDQIRTLSAQGLAGEEILAELAISDIRRAADLFRAIYDSTHGRDGWVSMEISPLLIHDPVATTFAAMQMYKIASRLNLFVEIPGCAACLVPIENALFAGIPVNVTLLFSTDQYLKVADAYMRALERRIAAGLKPDVACVASFFVSRWDDAVRGIVPTRLENKLGIAIAQRTYGAYWAMLNSQRWLALKAAGAKSQRLVWASTGTKDSMAPASLYVSALGAPNTINTMPEKTLLAFAAEGVPSSGMFADAVDPEPILDEFEAVGVHTATLASELQEEGMNSFLESWHSLLAGIEEKRAMFASPPVIS